MKLKNFPLVMRVGRKERIHKREKGERRLEGGRGKQERSINVGGKNCEKCFSK